MYGAADWLAENTAAAPAAPTTGNAPAMPNGAPAANNAGGDANVEPKIGTAVSMAEPSPELVSLRSTLGEANFQTLSGDDRTIKVVFASLGPTGAAAEVEQITDAGKLIDLYALADLALSNEDLTAEKKLVLEQVQTSVKEKLGSLLSACSANGSAEAPTMWDCLGKISGTEIALLATVVIVAILLVALILTYFFRRRCPKPLR